VKGSKSGQQMEKRGVFFARTGVEVIFNRVRAGKASRQAKQRAKAVARKVL